MAQYCEDSATRAMLIPEIVAEILSQYKHSRGDLFRYALVCKQWASLSLRQLWGRDDICFDVFSKTHKNGNLWKYIHIIRSLCVDGEECPKGYGTRRIDSFGEFAAPVAESYQDVRLVKLHGTSRVGSRAYSLFKNCLCSSLRSIQIEGFSHHVCLEDFLGLIPNRCPHLETIDMPLFMKSNVTEEAIFRFLSSMARLRKISGLGSVSNLIWLKLSQLPQLQSLSVLSTDDHEWCTELLASTEDDSYLFPSLVTFQVNCSTTHETELSSIFSDRMFTKLRSLSLTFISCWGGNELITRLKNCPSLQDVKLDIHMDRGIDESSLEVATPANVRKLLQNCKRLLNLSIRCMINNEYHWPRKYPSHLLQDGEFCSIFDEPLDIRGITLPWSVSFGVKEMLALSKSCPHLEMLHLEGSKLNYAELRTARTLPILPDMLHFLDCENEQGKIFTYPRRYALPNATFEALRTNQRLRRKLFISMFPQILSPKIA